MKNRLIVLATVILFLMGLGFFWWNYSLSAIDPTSKSFKFFVVQKGDGVREISSRLKKEELIRNQVAFFLLIKKLGIDQKLQAGEFKLSPAMNGSEIAQALTTGMMDIWVTIPEGLRDEEIALKLASDLAIPESEFLKYAQEGYMFPDTYAIPQSATAPTVAKIFRENFDKKLTPDLKKEATKSGLSLGEIITMASVVEKEARGDEDRSIIAGILLKRLKNDWPLQVDATLQYVLGYQPEEKSWWKKVIYDEDKKIVSPYNTYLNLGLPPNPICNPGLASIKAVISPVSSDYWYYLHDQNGVAHFAKTQAEHEENIAKYLE